MTPRRLLLSGLLAVFSAGLSPLAAPAQGGWQENSIEIAKASTEHEWPFSVDRGELKCVIFGGQRLVLFIEPDTNDPDWFAQGVAYDIPRSVIVSTNPLEIFASLEDVDLFLPFDSDLAVLIRRLAPFAAMGQALCDALQASGAANGDDHMEDGE